MVGITLTPEQIRIVPLPGIPKGRLSIPGRDIVRLLPPEPAHHTFEMLI
jgi:hypothetical protein